MLTRRTLFLALIAGVYTCAAVAQTTYSPHFVPLKVYPEQQIQADLNGDGIPDFLVFSSGGTTEVLSNGSGSYSTRTLPIPAGNSEALASGDFNGDGKNDVLFYSYTGGDKLFVLGLGDGKGNFSSFVTAPNLPGVVTGSLFTINGATGDFNGDGRPDVALAYQEIVGSMYRIRVELFLNNGDGFTDAGPIFTYNMPSGSQGGVEYQTTPEFDLLTGDFDADGHADLALRYLITPPNNPVEPDANLVILYGNGAGKFTPVNVFTNRQSFLVFNSADLNDDGFGDLAGVDSDHTVHIFYGHANRKMTESVISAAATGESALDGTAPALGDFDGNGLKDIVFSAQDPASTTESTGVRGLYQTKPGTWVLGPYIKIDNFHVALGETAFTGMFVGDYNRDMKPDASLFVTDTSSNHPESAALLLNTGSKAYGACAAPAIGIHVCSPGATASSSSVTFNLSATSLYPLRKMEVWIDGVKKSETYHVFGTQGYDRVTLSLAAGKHKVGVYAVAVDESMKLHSSFTLTVQ